MDYSETIRVIAAVVEEGGKYLVCQRAPHKRHGGLWEFPGGKVEPGETTLDAARRELAEELGVHVQSVGDMLLAVRDPGSHFVIEFHAVSIQGDPTCLEHSALAWYSPAELITLPLAPSDYRFAASITGRAS